MSSAPTETPVRTAIEITVYLLLILAILVWCFQIITPFISFLVWGTIIAVSAYKPCLKLRAALGERSKPTVIIFALIGMSVFIIPAWMFAGSIIESGQELNARFQAEQFHVPPPNEAVKDWPLVGEKVYGAWETASTNFQEFLHKYHDQLAGLAQRAIKGAAGAALSILQLVAATLIAAVLLANDVATATAYRRFFRRLAGDKGEEISLPPSCIIALAQF